MRDDFSRTADVKNFEDVVDHHVGFTPGEIVQICILREESVLLWKNCCHNVHQLRSSYLPLTFNNGQIVMNNQME